MRNEFQKQYKLSHQILRITGMNMTEQTLIGSTELTLLPNKDSLRYVWLNCKQCRVYSVMFNDTVPASFTYRDPLGNVTQQKDRHNRNIEFLNKQLCAAGTSVNPELERGEILVTVPVEAQCYVTEGVGLRVTVEFSLEKPRSGLHFVPSRGEDTLSVAERGAHMFSYGTENDSRLWFPCVDSWSELCTWRLEVTVEPNMVAVCTGDLHEVVEGLDLHRTYVYTLNQPTAAPNIGLAVGPFAIYVDPYMHELTHFCIPTLLPLVKSNCKYLHQAFEFFENVLNTRYPYSCYKQVYVDEAYSDIRNYATLGIMSQNLLCSSRIIDQVYHTRQCIVLAVARQFFGCFLTRHSWCDSWVCEGVARYLTGIYVKRVFGFNHYKHWIQDELKAVVEYEEQFGSIVLDPSACGTEPKIPLLSNGRPNDPSSGQDVFYFSVKNPHACSPRYIEHYYRKSQLVIRMLELRIGYELMLQVFNKHMSLGVNAVESGSVQGWSNLLLSTATFSQQIFTVTGKDITTFCDANVRQGGHAKFEMSFNFNRKRNIVEMTIAQNNIGQTGIKRYDGPLVVWLQELDGTFKHTLQIEQVIAKKEIVCHSKSRRNKKKKIPVCTGEEVDMDLSMLDADSPVLWLRLDPDLSMLRSVATHQPDTQWQYQLRHERDVTAQVDAIEALHRMAKRGSVSQEIRASLTAVLENEDCYYKVRCLAAHCLTTVANAMAPSWSGPPAMLHIFRRLFGSYSCPNIIRLHDFENLQHYFLLKTLPKAMAGLRNIHKVCPPEILTFLFDLVRYSDNIKNQMSDNYYRASVIEALATAISPVAVKLNPLSIVSDNMPETYRKILGEVTKCLNLEKILPCYKFTVTISCLHAIRVMQKNGHLPPKNNVFQTYAAYPVFIEVRLGAVDQLIDFLREDGTVKDVEFLLELAETDPMPLMRYEVLRRLAINKPFDIAKQNVLDKEFIVERLWRLMNGGSSTDSRVRGAAMDLYFSLYGRRKPYCLQADRSSSHGSSHGSYERSSNSYNSPHNSHKKHSSLHHHNKPLHQHQSTPVHRKPTPSHLTPAPTHPLARPTPPHQPHLISFRPEDNIVNLDDPNRHLPPLVHPSHAIRVKQEVTEVPDDDSPFLAASCPVKQEVDCLIKQEVPARARVALSDSDSDTELVPGGSSAHKPKKRKKDKKNKKAKRAKPDRPSKSSADIADKLGFGDGNLSSDSSDGGASTISRGLSGSGSTMSQGLGGGVMPIVFRTVKQEPELMLSDDD